MAAAVRRPTGRLTPGIQWRQPELIASGDGHGVNTGIAVTGGGKSQMDGVRSPNGIPTIVARIGQGDGGQAAHCNHIDHLGTG